MLLHAALALQAAWRSSPTIDEFAHVPAGLSYWQTGTFGLYHHNPPLAKLLAALPVLVSRPVVDYSGSWARARERGEPPNQVEFGADFMRANQERYFDLFRRARLPIVMVSLAGLWLVFLWSRRLWGETAGLLAAALWAFEPNLVANASLATTDLAAAVLFAAAVFALVHCLERPSPGAACLAGLVFGLALLTKFTALLLLPIGALLALARWMWPALPKSSSKPASSSIAPSSPRRLILVGLLVPIVALLVLNLGYLFEGTGRRLGSFPFLSPALTRPRTGGEIPRRQARFYQMLYEQRQNRFEGTWLGALPVPLPEEYLLGLDEQSFEANPGIPGGGYAVALRGTIRRGGWWWYDLYALLVKVPLAVWGLGLVAAGAAALVPAARARRFEELAWLLPAATVLVAMTVMTGLDIGVRYLLPILPFVFVGMARLASPAVTARFGRASRLAVGAGIAWLTLGTLLVHPHELSYFNEAAGGPSGGGRHLLDSNIDWGQDLLELRRVLDRHAESEPIGLAYFGAVDPALAGIRWRLPPRDPRVIPKERVVDSDLEPLQGLYAISVNFVYGFPFRVLGPDGRTLPIAENAFGYFRTLTPIDRAGYSILLYRIGEAEAARIAEEWQKPVAPPGSGS